MKLEAYLQTMPTQVCGRPIELSLADISIPEEGTFRIQCTFPIEHSGPVDKAEILIVADNSFVYRSSGVPMDDYIKAPGTVTVEANIIVSDVRPDM